MRIAITGGPKTGKTTLAASHRGIVKHTDDVMHLGWSEASQEVSGWFDGRGDVTIEGVAVPRALRKWLQRSIAGKPVDTLIVLHQPKAHTTDGQRRMAAGVHTVLAEITAELLGRGVRIENR